METCNLNTDSLFISTRPEVWRNYCEEIIATEQSFNLIEKHAIHLGMACDRQMTRSPFKRAVISCVHMWFRIEKSSRQSPRIGFAFDTWALLWDVSKLWDRWYCTDARGRCAGMGSNPVQAKGEALPSHDHAGNTEQNRTRTMKGNQIKCIHRTATQTTS